MTDMSPAEPDDKSTLRTLVAVGTLTYSLVGFANKARKAKGSSDLLDHADVIAGLTSLVVLLARARRARRETA